MGYKEDLKAHDEQRRSLIDECSTVLYAIGAQNPEPALDGLMALHRCREAVNNKPYSLIRVGALGFLEGYYVGVRSPQGADHDSLFAILALAAREIANARLPDPDDEDDTANPDLTEARSLIARASDMAKAKRTLPPLPEEVCDACGHGM